MIIRNKAITSPHPDIIIEKLNLLSPRILLDTPRGVFLVLQVFSLRQVFFP